MIVAVAPEPPTWLPPDATRVITVPRLARRASTAWANGRADRRIAAGFALRHAVDLLAARRLPPDVDVVYAASLAARHTFAAARRRQPAVRCVLVEDLPDLRGLHDDLDRAAAVHADARFLRRYRADRSQLVRQAAERVLADAILVRSDFARAARIEGGVPPDRVQVLGDAPVIGARRERTGTRPTMLLAGLASARAGLYEALAVLDAVAGATLVVRAGEGLEPPDALDRPRVRQATSSELELTGIDLVLAPSWCEADVAHVPTAARLGIPVVATDRAAGRVDLARAGAQVDPGDVPAMIAAVEAQLAG